MVPKVYKPTAFLKGNMWLLSTFLLKLKGVTFSSLKKSNMTGKMPAIVLKMYSLIYEICHLLQMTWSMADHLYDVKKGD
jgi:hypothetical protein